MVVEICLSLRSTPKEVFTADMMFLWLINLAVSIQYKQDMPFIHRRAKRLIEKDQICLSADTHSIMFTYLQFINNE
jgi:hypothetical protein